MNTNRHHIGRRQFLIGSSACAVAAAVVGPKLFAGEAGAPPRRLAVGFAPIDEATDVMAAAAIPAADGGFIGRGARISASGSSGASADPIARRAVELVAHYSYFDGAERREAPFRAWGCSRHSGAQGSPISFTVPVDEQQRIAFSVETERGVPAGGAATRRDSLFSKTTESATLPVTLSLQNEPNAFKLARGTYVIVPLFDGDSEPDWRGFELRARNGRVALHDRAGDVAPFDHFVLRVDYAGKP